MSHTPGPWTARPSFSMHWDYAIETDDVDIAHVLRLAHHDEPRELAIGRANAHLIAAAPELLAALKTLRFILEALDLDPIATDYTSILERADLAIAKAEGKP